MSIRVCKINLNSLFVFTDSDDCMIKITNILNWICLYTLHKHQAPINTLSIDPYQATTLISGCYNGTLCSWDNDCLKQIHVNAHPSSIIIDINISDHSSTKR
ncbi:unnamed protein product [Rotaria sp. Silwood1]|nr:unnamed protein product [Rotaria sp. Silwood1]CAF1662579.1 unnamed protein product [Rotaria sp. Silwood1]CAF3843847.1 unnamed protein product [Rotaria sp. Silwood1]CAF3900546.1 unnamed protein product [Rotaria sp. Silwood1]CAF3933997.1 unnamed protein product [Rotaria sp. Silwood1]